jgi:hypothetical protein
MADDKYLVISEEQIAARRRKSDGPYESWSSKSSKHDGPWMLASKRKEKGKKEQNPAKDNTRGLM